MACSVLFLRVYSAKSSLPVLGGYACSHWRFAGKCRDCITGEIEKMAMIAINRRVCQARPLHRADLAHKMRKKNPGWKNNHCAFDGKMKSGYSRANFPRQWSDSFFLNAKQRDSIERDFKQKSKFLSRLRDHGSLRDYIELPFHYKGNTKIERGEIFITQGPKKRKRTCTCSIVASMRVTISRQQTRRPLSYSRVYISPSRTRVRIKSTLSFDEQIAASETKPLSTITSERTLPKNKSL